MTHEFVPGRQYRRKDIHLEYGGQAQGGISTPAKGRFVFLFTGDAGEQYGYRDGWTENGTYLYTGEGQVGDMQFIAGNRAIRDHKANSRELLLFKQVRKAYVEFVGKMECDRYQLREGLDRNGDRRQTIVFELRPTEAYRSLKLVETSEDLRRNSTIFNREARFHAARSLNLLRQTIFWVYDEESTAFAPSKFVGYQNMDFSQYEAAVRGEMGGARFDGHVTRLAIEGAVRGKFSEDPTLTSNLLDWGEELFGVDAFAGTNSKKWQFVRLVSNRNYWAFASNPLVYRIEEALANLAEDTWTVGEHDVRRGDRFLIWRAKGGSEYRGVIGLGEVLSDPDMMEPAAEGIQYCLDNALLIPKKRVRIRYVTPSHAPLWLDDDRTDTLAGLSVARATGGTVFHVSADEWRTVLRLLGGWPLPPGMDRPGRGEVQPRNSGRQGFAVDPGVRTAIEKYSMDLAERHYRKQGYEVERRGKPYDLRCTKDETVLYVEVKATQTVGDNVLLTPNEVVFSKRHSMCMELFIVSSCTMSGGASNPIVCGGVASIIKPWSLNPAALTPTGFTYSLAEHKAKLV